MPGTAPDQPELAYMGKTGQNSRIMKCDKRNSKLERFEETVDGVMDWIYDAELFVSSAVDGTHEAVKERTDRLEVMIVLWLLFCLFVWV